MTRAKRDSTEDAPLKLAYPLMAVIALAALPGCGSSISGYCDDYCDCRGCSDDDYADCVDNLEDAERRAENEGCEDRFDEYFSCLNDQFECRSGGRVDQDGCESEAVTLGRCVGPF